MFVLAFVLIHVIALTVIATAVHHAPEGYEDETGFHFVRPPLPGCGGPSRLLPLIFGAIGLIPDLLP